VTQLNRSFCFAYGCRRGFCAPQDLFRTNGDYVAASAWHQRAASYLRGRGSPEERRSALENMSLAEEDLAEFYREQENFAESARHRFRAADILQSSVRPITKRDFADVRARVLCIRAWGFAALANSHFFRRQYRLAVHQRQRASHCFLLASRLRGVCGTSLGRRCRAYSWEYRAWQQLARAGTSWRSANYDRSVKELDRAVAYMNLAVHSDIEEYDRIRLTGYRLYLRALMLRSHAWLALSRCNYASAIEALKEAVHVLAESCECFPLVRDRSWAEGNLLLMTAQRCLACAVMRGCANGEVPDPMLSELLEALQLLKRSEECFTLQALRQRSRQAAYAIKEVISEITSGRPRAGLVAALKSIVTDESIF
jgi:tetratricopeptide (TPR) repeat protein